MLAIKHRPIKFPTIRGNFGGGFETDKRRKCIMPKMGDQELIARKKPRKIEQRFVAPQKIRNLRSLSANRVAFQSNILPNIPYDISVPNYSKNLKIHYQSNIRLIRPQRNTLHCESTVLFAIFWHFCYIFGIFMLFFSKIALQTLF
jgi:hypothetical protein